MPQKPPVIVITGPTSSGKSDLAIQLAQELSGLVISADSRQIYQTMDLGTGKVPGHWEDFFSISENVNLNKTKGSRKKLPLEASLKDFSDKLPSEIFQKNHLGKTFLSEGIPHFLLDFISPQEKGAYNVTQFRKDCRWLIHRAHQNNKLPIICGGTGFWIQTVTQEPTLPPVPPHPELRTALEKETTQDLFGQLKKKDPARAQTIDSHNRPRLIRALEICHALGQVPPVQKNKKPPEFDFLQFVLDRNKEELADKISRRLDQRWQQGMVTEVKSLRDKFQLSWEEIQSFGLAYHWIPRFIQGEVDQEELRQRVFWAERNYAKRQLTWLRKQSDLIWVKDYSQILSQTKKFLTARKQPSDEKRSWL